MTADSGLLRIAMWPAPGGWRARKVGFMDHREAIETMASERYLLDELSPELRDAYEEHLFSCTECAGDAMLGGVFVDRAKILLPTMKTAIPVRDSRAATRTERRDWFAWIRPSVLVPVFGFLLCIIGYQNLVTYPALEVAANEPRVLPAAMVLHGDTRGGLPVVHADLILGSAITVELPEGANYATYKFDCYNSAGKLIWSRAFPVEGEAHDTQTIWLPGHIKQDTYKLALSGVTSSGETIPVQQNFFDLKIDSQVKK
jgi:hypothetical protein